MSKEEYTSALQVAIQDLTKQLRRSIPDIKIRILQSMLLGGASALGALLALALVVPIVILLLKNFEWVPFIGDFVAQIAEHMQSARAGQQAL